MKDSMADPIEKVLHVADVMMNTPITLNPTHSFSDAVTLMANHHFHHCLIVDSTGRLAGVVSDRDILRALSRTKDRETKNVSEIMTREPFTVRSGTLLMDAVATMVTEHINCLPVVNDDGSVCGILTSTDLLKSFQTVLGWLRKKALTARTT